MLTFLRRRGGEVKALQNLNINFDMIQRYSETFFCTMYFITKKVMLITFKVAYLEPLQPSWRLIYDSYRAGLFFGDFVTVSARYPQLSLQEGYKGCQGAVLKIMGKSFFSYKIYYQKKSFVLEIDEDEVYTYVLYCFFLVPVVMFSPPSKFQRNIESSYFGDK